MVVHELEMRDITLQHMDAQLILSRVIGIKTESTSLRDYNYLQTKTPYFNIMLVHLCILPSPVTPNEHCKINLKLFKYASALLQLGSTLIWPSPSPQPDKQLTVAIYA